MTHPCAGHSCDHCYLCDVVGVCCATVPKGSSVAAAGVATDPDESLRLAIVAERSARQLRALIRAEALPAGEKRAALLAAAPDPVRLPIEHHNRKETVNVSATRSSH